MCMSQSAPKNVIYRMIYRHVQSNALPLSIYKHVERERDHNELAPCLWRLTSSSTYRVSQEAQTQKRVQYSSSEGKQETQEESTYQSGFQLKDEIPFTLHGIICFPQLALLNAIGSKNTLTQTLKIMFDQVSAHPMAQSS